MKLTLSGHHLKITDALRESCEHKFNKLERHFAHINQVNVILAVEKLQHIAEATLYINGGELHALAKEADMYAAIDSLVDKLDRQLEKHKDKHH